MMNRASIPTLLTAALILLSCTREARSAAPRRLDGRPRTIVLELFTSQGCSSCPPADRLLSRLRREDFAGATVIPLAYHVDYWDHLGWSDPFSSPRWSQRQRAYASALREPQVYTPQLIVNGTAQLVGSSEGAVRQAIARQREEADRGVISIDSVLRTGDELTANIRARLDTDARANAVVVLYEDGITTAVPRGENANRTLVDDAIVRWQDRAFEIDGKSARAAKVTIRLDPAWDADRMGIAAFLQDTRSLAIYAGASHHVPR